MHINVSLPVEIKLHATTFIGPTGEQVKHWYSVNIFGRDLAFGGEVENYHTSEAARLAAIRTVRKWATDARARVFGLTTK